MILRQFQLRINHLNNNAKELTVGRGRRGRHPEIQEPCTYCLPKNNQHKGLVHTTCKRTITSATLIKIN